MKGYDRLPPIMKGYERCSKILRIRRKFFMKWVLSISRDYWFYFEKVSQNSNSERVRRIKRLFLRADLILRPAWQIPLRIRVRSRNTQPHLTPVAGSNLLEHKVSRFSELSQNLNSEKLFQSKTSNLVKWTKLILADYSFTFSAFYYLINHWGFSLYVSFSKRAAQILGDLWIHPTAPRNEHIKMDVPRFEISQEKFGEWRLFSPSEFDPATGVKTI